MNHGACYRDAEIVFKQCISRSVGISASHMVISRATLRKQSSGNTHQTSGITHYINVEAEVEMDRTLPTLADTPEKQEQSYEPGVAGALDDLYYEPQVEEPQQGQLGEEDWEKANEFRDIVVDSPSPIASQVDEAVMVATEIRHVRESSVGSVAGVKRKHKDVEEVDEVNLTGDDTIEDNVELQEQVRAKLGEQDDEQPDGQNHELAQPVRSPSSPTTSQHLRSPSVAPQDIETAPTTLAPQPQIEPRREPRKTPVLPPPMSNRGPYKELIKKPATRSRKQQQEKAPAKSKREEKIRGPPAKKEPRSQAPLSPNSQLDDLDADKLWCICRQADDFEPMIACDAVPRCKTQWFHQACVGLEKSPPARQRWFCAEHRKQAKSIAKVKRRRGEGEGEGEEGEGPVRATRGKKKGAAISPRSGSRGR